MATIRAIIKRSTIARDTAHYSSTPHLRFPLVTVLLRSEPAVERRQELVHNLPLGARAVEQHALGDERAPRRAWPVASVPAVECS